MLIFLQLWRINMKMKVKWLLGVRNKTVLKRFFFRFLSLMHSTWRYSCLHFRHDCCLITTTRCFFVNTGGLWSYFGNKWKIDQAPSLEKWRKVKFSLRLQVNQAWESHKGIPRENSPISRKNQIVNGKL